MGIRPESKSEVRVWVVQDAERIARTDQVATEEPLEIRLRAGRAVDGRGPVPVFRRQGAGERTVSITMRTPGHDFELAAGFLYAEGIVRGADDIHALSHSDDARLEEDRRFNTVNVDLRGDTLPDLQSLERRTYTTSACGVCGKASLEALRLRGAPAIEPGPVVEPDLLRALKQDDDRSVAVMISSGTPNAAQISARENFRFSRNCKSLLESSGFSSWVTPDSTSGPFIAPARQRRLRISASSCSRCSSLSGFLLLTIRPVSPLFWIRPCMKTPAA
jgi:formate dehydrogenase assembly factor FdhD